MNQQFRLVLFFVLLAAKSFAQPYNNEWIDYNKTYYKFKLFGFGYDAAGSPIPKGMVHISYATLAAAGLGNVKGKDLQLWRNGEEVPVYVTASGQLTSNDYVEFWGEINNGKLDRQLYSNPDFQLSDKWSLLTDTAAYFLTVNTASANKRLVDTPNDVAGTSLSPEAFFMHTIGRYYRTGEISNGFYASSGQNLYSSSYDRGEGWVSRPVRPVACNSNISLPQNFSDLHPYLPGGYMTLKVNAVGNAPNSRVVRVQLNGDEVAIFQMDYINYAKVEEMLPVNHISSGNANFLFINQSPNTCDDMRVSMVELNYPRQFHFGNASVFEFEMPASSNGRFLQITGFDHGGVAPVLYDLQNGRRYVADITNVDTVKVVLQPSSLPYKLVLTTQQGNYYKEIDQLQSRSFINYHEAANQGNYLIISNPLIYGNDAQNFVEQYRDYRASIAGGGYNAAIVDVHQLEDQFAYGVKKHPVSIKNFLKFARQNFINAPQFVFLIGKGVTYNQYRQYEDHPAIEQLNLVPTWGNPASDNLLASNDFRAIPATPIGRLSAVTAEEVGDYLQKVKQYDSAQSNISATVTDKLWMKNVLQIAGANDVALGDSIDNYLSIYKNLITDTSFGGRVTNYSKTADPAGYTDAIVSFKNTYESGSSLITYFGHSSSTSLDFNLDDPQNYNNQGKYPVFIANGCSAGNHFAFEHNRLNNKTTISEKFVLAPDKGAIGYLASTHFGVINYLHLYTREFYKAIGKTKYAATAGEIIQHSIGEALNVTGSLDFYSRMHAETYAWHGDPAIRFNAFNLPDMAVEEPGISYTPTFISVADTSFTLQANIYNLGKAVEDTVTITVKRQWPGGKEKIIDTLRLPALHFADSFLVAIPVTGNLDKGDNLFTISVNTDTSFAEITWANNSATKLITVSEEEIRPVYPYQYAIINNPNAALVASTVNPQQPVQDYVLEIDTTALFNSAFKKVMVKTSAGGVISLAPPFAYAHNQTYYWRVAPAGSANWRNSSFVYRSGEEGAQQGHVHQLLHSTMHQVALDSTAGYRFLNQNHNLFVANAMYPTSGTEDGHFSISVDGANIIRSACLGSSIIFNVFDSLTFLPWRNTTQPFGAAPVCNAGREFNFEYSYRTPAGRKNAMDFLQSIPTGSYVVARLINDAPYNVYVNHWQDDTALYGSGNSLFHLLKSHGFHDLDSFTFPRTWAFVFQKNIPSFEPVSVFSEGVYDKIVLSKNAVSPHLSGHITSPAFGPALSWNKVQWSGKKTGTGNAVAMVDVIGIKHNNQQDVLQTLQMTQQDADIAWVDATVYPFIKLHMRNSDSVTAIPYQKDMWRVLYNPAREGAIAPNVHFTLPDTVGYNTTYHFNLPVEVAFKNVSPIAFDSVAANIILIDTAGNQQAYQSFTLAPVAAGDSVILSTVLDVQALKGWYNVLVQFNPGLVQPEQFSFNNFLFKQVLVQTNTTLPVTLLQFTAQPVADDVLLHWNVAAESGMKEYRVEHAVDGNNFTIIGNVAAGNHARQQYSYLHNNAPKGKNFYRLQMVDQSGEITYSPVRLVNKGRELVVKLYPNPVLETLNISVQANEAEPLPVRIVNMHGQQVWLGKCKGSVQVNTSGWSKGAYLVMAGQGPDAFVTIIQKQ